MLIKPKKSLGQNFLHDENIINKIVNASKISSDDQVLEVGPGTGNLTKLIISQKPKKIYVIEKDSNLVLLLKKNFKNQIEILNNDVLKVNENLLSKEKLVVFGNLPYNISTEILCKWILNFNDKKFWFSNLILMFQKEVAERIISKFNTSSYGRLSILANWRLEINKICDVKPISFSPKPKVDSSLLFLKPKKKFLNFDNPKNLEEITRIFFNHRRKMIKKPFNQIFNGNKNVLNKLKIDLNLRPQNLDVEMYYQLTSEYEKLIC